VEANRASHTKGRERGCEEVTVTEVIATKSIPFTLRKTKKTRNFGSWNGLIPPWNQHRYRSGGGPMRVFGSCLVALAAAFVAVGLVGGQQPGGKGKGGFGKGGFGGGFGPQDAASLVKNEQVKKELNITDEQVEKIPAAILKGLSGVLDEKQMTRLRQIELQQRGTQAFLDASVQKELKITPEQSGNIKTILSDSVKERQELMAELKGGGGGGFEKLNALTKETNEKVQGVLTADQRRAYKQMLGEEFKLQGMKGGFGGGGKGKKKQDI
jgi:hypothetical protein